jgi:hypothetical protein
MSPKTVIFLIIEAVVVGYVPKYLHILHFYRSSLTYKVLKCVIGNLDHLNGQLE